MRFICYKYNGIIQLNRLVNGYFAFKNDHFVLSHDVMSGSDITHAIKSILVSNVMMSIMTLRKRWQNLDVFTLRNAICKYVL